MHNRLLSKLTANEQKSYWFLSTLKSFFILIFFLLLCKDTWSQKNLAASTVNKPLFGVASFYDRHMEGEMTATGEAFHHNLLTAASNNFALNTWIRITNLKNGKSVIVRINDRMSKGMQALGRVADMTRTAAKQLDFLNRGLARVKVEEITRL